MPQLLSISLLIVALATPSLMSQETPIEVPTEVPVTLDITTEGADYDATGQFDLVIRAVALADLERPYSLTVAFLLDGRRLFLRDHRPPKPTSGWKKGDSLSWRLPSSLPFDLTFGKSGKVEIRMAFVDGATGKKVPPRGFSPNREGRVRVGEMALPSWDRIDGPEQRQTWIDVANGHAKEGRPLRARNYLATAIRLATEDVDKRALRDALLALKRPTPREISSTEADTVAKRIADEKNRYLRQRAGRLHDRGYLHAALKILDDIGGRLEQDAAEAVIGAVNAVQRSQKDRQDIRRKIRDRISHEERDEALALAEKLGRGKKLLDRAISIEKKGRLALARAMFKTLRFSEDTEVRNEAYRHYDAIGARLVAEIPDNEAAMVNAAVNHPCWARTTTRTSHEFIFIGPKTLVEGIPVNSIRDFDLAYIFLTDLFGRISNPGGDRITVYFKELWDFGGGQAGPGIIDIGRADPDRKGYRVNTGLFYHELTHCIENVQPKFAGFTEGLADLGAIHCEEMIARKRPSPSLIKTPLEAFRRHYLSRDIEYWRIKGYDPSCGFFVHFLDRYAKGEDGRHDWKTYRQFFREYREVPIRDGREHRIIRALAFYLVRVFGEKAFDDLRSFRFPLTEDDRRAIALELTHYRNPQATVDEKSGDNAREALQEFANSYVERDELTKLMMEMVRRRDPADEIKEFAQDELGLLFDWQVIGPMRLPGTDPDTCVFPPELEINLGKEYQFGANRCRWKKPGNKPPIRLMPHGWTKLTYNYQDNSAIYAVTWVKVDADHQARLHVRADDDLSVFIDDRLVGKYRNRGRNGSSWLWWRGPAAEVPDGMTFPFDLKAGWHKVLLKIKNRHGPAGFAFAISKIDGTPLDDLESRDTAPPAETKEEPGKRKKTLSWKRLVRHRFDSKSYRSKLQVTVGRFKVSRKRLEGVDRQGRVLWRPFTVRPGVKKDSPSNLFWLKSKYTKSLADFQFELDLDAAAPKITVTFMGEGKDDGLSGWTLIVHPAGQGRTKARLERYDRLIYECAAVEIPQDVETRQLRMELLDGRFRATLDGVTLFENRPIRAIDEQTRVGVATWGPDTAIRSLELKTRQK